MELLQYAVLALLTITTVISIVILINLKSTRKDKSEEILISINNEIYNLGKQFKDEFFRTRQESKEEFRGTREELSNTLNRFGNQLSARIREISDLQKEQLEIFSNEIKSLRKISEEKFEKLTDKVGQSLKEIEENNSKKLEEMRITVDEKLHSTLEKRLGESFKQVSERLEKVHQGLGEMQNLATGVGDLKKVLTNVKTRGTWGEIQLGNLIEQILTPDQYEKNVATKKGSQARVEFAIKLPGRNLEKDEIVWIPVDAKFPLEDYDRLVSAKESANKEAIEKAQKDIEKRIKEEAKQIATKYIDPPNTTEFAIMFLPMEGLYAEVLSIQGLAQFLQNTYKVVIAGPTNLAAILNSLQMGFKTLAIEKRSSEVWKILGAVKTEFGKFGDLLEKTQQKLDSASKSIGDASRKSRTIERKLKSVEELPGKEAANLLE